MVARQRKGLFCCVVLSCLLFDIEAQTLSRKRKNSARPVSEKVNDTTTHLLKNKGELLKEINLNLLLRNSIEIPKGDQAAAIKANETRVEIMGKIKPVLDFRVRFRLNKSLRPRSSDNSPGAIDHASINWTFGEKQQWSLNVGKQSAAIGSWEFEKNPTYEYQYSDFINSQTNIFLTAARLGYQVNNNHTFSIQLHNTWNDNFETIYKNTNYSTNGLKAAKLPMGIYFAWMGNFFEKKWQTFYSYNVSQFAKGKANQSLALGNKLVLPKVEAYLDIQFQTLGMDYTNLASPIINNYRTSVNPAIQPGFAENINYKSVVLRVDWEFIPNWFITAKGMYENASQMEGAWRAGRNFKNKYSYLTGIEYKPVKLQNMKIFGYYYNDKVAFNNTVAVANRDIRTHLFAVGFLYFVNVF